MPKRTPVRAYMCPDMRRARAACHFGRLPCRDGSSHYQQRPRGMACTRRRRCRTPIRFRAGARGIQMPTSRTVIEDIRALTHVSQPRTRTAAVIDLQASDLETYTGVADATPSARASTCRYSFRPGSTGACPGQLCVADARHVSTRMSSHMSIHTSIHMSIHLSIHMSP